MKILFSWLKEFLELSLSPEALADLLTLGGAEVTGLSRLEDDWLFELEITPNRPDLLSHLGMARESAALLGRPFRFPRWLKREMVYPDNDPTSFSVVIDDAQGCRRYVGIVIEGVHIGPSPAEVIQRLHRLGHRSINNIVDITNLCLLELGQPLHAFDLDRLDGTEICVRSAVSGETLLTLDGVSRKLSSGMVVIADRKHAIALAGVMGGQETEIHPGTKRVLLESAWFDSSSIHRTSQALKLSSDSSYRFERGIDPEMVPLAAIRAARLITTIARGAISGAFLDAGQTKCSERSISLRPRQAQSVLGMRIYPAQQKRLLERVGCRVVGTARGWRVSPPSWRADLQIAEDLHEELARLWGYDRCPETLPPLPRREGSQWKLLEEPKIKTEEKIRQCLVAGGFQEIYTYSLLSPEDHAKIRLTMGPVVVEIENPLSIEQAVLRKSLLVGALRATAYNLHRKTATAFRFFEMGTVFYKEMKEGEKPTESRKLSLLAAGTPEPEWGLQQQPLDIFHLKGIIDLLVQRVGVEVSEGSPETAASYFIGQQIPFRLGKKTLGYVGLIHPKILAAYEIPEEIPVAYGELDLGLLTTADPSSWRMQKIPKVPQVSRDVAIVVSEETRYEALLQTIQSAGKPLLTSVALFDLYHGRQILSGKKSFAFRLSFSSGDRSLTDEEVAIFHKKIVEALAVHHGAVLR